MRLTVDDIRILVEPVAKKYGLKAVYLFGSYADGSQDDASDVDLVVDTSGTGINSLFKLGALYADLEEALGVPIDMITADSLEQEPRTKIDADFRRSVFGQRVELYAAA